MVFGRKSKARFFLGESELQIVDNYKYLGLVVDKNFTWRKHLDKILDKARKRIKALWFGIEGGDFGEGIIERVASFS